MKNWIKKRIKNKISEINMVKKKPFGSGAEHVVYPSKKYSDRLYKVGKKDDVLVWLDVFKNNPKYFPRVFNYGKSVKNDKEYYYVEVEKLDTKRVLNEWSALQDAFSELGYIDEDNYEASDDTNLVFTESIRNSVYRESIERNLNHLDKNLTNLFIKWVEFLTEVTKIVNGVVSNLDIHRYNYGYDSSGKLKCLDI